MPDRPNVLVLIDNEHRSDAAGFASDDVVGTPTFDRLADSWTVIKITSLSAIGPVRAAIRRKACREFGPLHRT